MHALTAQELRQFVEANEANLHEMTAAEFRDWLGERIEAHRGRAMFDQRCKIRDLRKQYRRPLQDRERRLRLAEQLYAQNPASVERERLEQQVGDLEQAVAGLTRAVANNQADPNKLADYEGRLRDVREMIQALDRRLPEKRRLDRARQSLARYEEQIGLTAAERELETISTSRGTSSVSAGSRFEKRSSKATSRLIVPRVTEPHESAHVLHGVTMGCARGEIDQLVVVTSPDSSSEVRAVIEAKRNINDLVHGFRLRQENLAWFVGDEAGYEPEQYRTSVYTAGEFTVPAVHEEEGESFQLDRRSFHHFAEADAPPFRLSGLYFVTEQRPLLGVTTAELGRIMHRVATDPGFDLERKSVVGRFRKWVLSIVDPFQTRDVLHLFARSEHWAQQVIFCENNS